MAAEELERFTIMFRQPGKARIMLAATLTGAGVKTATFKGAAVAVRLATTTGG